MDLQAKIQAMLWDMPADMRTELANKILADPLNAFREDERLFIEALNSLRWYELTSLMTKQELHSLLTDSIIRKLFPVQRRYYYANARRLLSKYFISSSG